jgi:hypothetical protein
MYIYRLQGSQELYILSYLMGRLTGRQLQAAPYNALSCQQSGPWKNVPACKINLFEKVYER